MATIITQFHLTAGPGPREISTIAYNGYTGDNGSSTLATHNLETGVTTHTLITGVSENSIHVVAWDSFNSRMLIAHQLDGTGNINLGVIDVNTGLITDFTHTIPTTTSQIRALIVPAATVAISLHKDGTIVRWDNEEPSWETTWSGTLNFTGDQVPRLNTAKPRTLAVNPNDGKIYCVLDADNGATSAGNLQAIGSFDIADISGAGTWDIDMAEHLLLDHTQSLVWMNP